MTKDEQDLLTHTGPGTPGGAFMRHYWHPVALCSELPASARPIARRILGEDLVLFRDDAGRPGLLGLLCSHRCADLSYGRVEDGGLRCLYHGWLYDVTGSVLEMPAEPPASTYKDKVRHTAYPCVEKGGLIFAYLGSGEPPVLPNYEFLDAPEERRSIARSFLNCNWLQALEGEIDPSHLSYLHRSIGKKDNRPVPGGSKPADEFYKTDVHPKLDVERTDFGLRCFSVRNAGPGERYLRITNYVLPCGGAIVGNEGRVGEGYGFHFHIPVDDTHHLRIDYVFNRVRAIDKAATEARQQSEIRPDGYLVRNASNRYLQDPHAMEVSNFTGMGEYFPAHDAFATESPGPIHDRSREHLGTGDVCIIAARKLLVDAVHAVERGEDPPHVLRDGTRNDMSDIAVVSAVVPDTLDYRTSWREAVKTLLPT